MSLPAQPVTVSGRVLRNRRVMTPGFVALTDVAREWLPR